MNYYPVLITTLNRYEHFRRCVESLSRCTHANETELVIGLDYPPSEKYREGYEKICAYIPEITGFKKVTCFKRAYNYGAINNCVDLVNKYFEIYDALIISEDDNEFAPCFLDFMNKALDMYKDEPKVCSVCGYLHESFYKKIPLTAYFVNPTCAWGMGVWKHKEKEYSEISYSYYENVLKSFKSSMKLLIKYPGISDMLISMVAKKQVWGDVMRSTYNILNDKYQLIPSMSTVRNWGHDGTGLHCGNNKKTAEEYAHQKIVEESYYPVEPQKIEIGEYMKGKLFFARRSNNRLKAVKNIIRVFLRYLKFCFFDVKK